MGEIQKAYNALASILRREGDDAYGTVESLRTGPIAMPKDQEWYQFVNHDPHFVNPDMPLRRIEDITYPGRDDPSASEIRAGMLERKSKYLKSYTPGWCVDWTLAPVRMLTFALGTSCRRRICTNSSRQTRSSLSLRSCLFICPIRSWARNRPRTPLLTSSCSRVARLVACTVVTLGSSVPSLTKP